MAPGKADGKECGEKNIPEPGSESEMRLELRIEWRGKRVIVNKRGERERKQRRKNTAELNEQRVRRPQSQIRI